MKYVALLRGINVGGNRKVDMGKLKAVCEKAGFTNVSTYINSGNVIFETGKKSDGKLAEDIERLLKKNFDFDVPVVVRSQAELKKVLSKIPKDWQNDAKQKTDVLFLWEKYDNKKTLDLIKINAAVDVLRYIPGAIVWHLDKKDYTKSKMDKFIGTEVYKNMTARNINTTRKLLELMEN